MYRGKRYIAVANSGNRFSPLKPLTKCTTRVARSENRKKAKNSRVISRWISKDSNQQPYSIRAMNVKHGQTLERKREELVI